MNCICHLGWDLSAAHQRWLETVCFRVLSDPPLFVAPLGSTLLCKNHWALPNIHFSAFCAKMFAKYQHRQLIKRHWQGVWKWQKGSGSVNGSPLSRLGLAEYRQHSGEKAFFPAMASDRSGGRGQSSGGQARLARHCLPVRWSWKDKWVVEPGVEELDLVDMQGWRWRMCEGSGDTWMTPSLVKVHGYL